MATKKTPAEREVDMGFSQLLWPIEGRDETLGIQAMWAMIDGRPECVGLSIWNGGVQGSGSSFSYRPIRGRTLNRIRATDVRDLPLATIIDKLRRAARERAAHNVALTKEFLEEKGWLEDYPVLVTKYFSDEEAPSGGRVGAPRKYDLAHYVEVAETYLRAWQDGENPTQAVADRFGISRTAAAKQVARARNEHKLLSTGRHGVAGAEPGPTLKRLRRQASKR